MTTWWTTKDSNLLNDATDLLQAAGYHLYWRFGTQGIVKFETKRFGKGTWDLWDAELGAPDLAFMVAMLLDLPHG